MHLEWVETGRGESRVMGQEEGRAYKNCQCTCRYMLTNLPLQMLCLHGDQPTRCVVDLDNLRI